MKPLNLLSVLKCSLSPLYCNFLSPLLNVSCHYYHDICKILSRCKHTLWMWHVFRSSLVSEHFTDSLLPPPSPPPVVRTTAVCKHFPVQWTPPLTHAGLLVFAAPWNVGHVINRYMVTQQRRLVVHDILMPGRRDVCSWIASPLQTHRSQREGVHKGMRTW